MKPKPSRRIATKLRSRLAHMLSPERMNTLKHGRAFFSRRSADRRSIRRLRHDAEGDADAREGSARSAFPEVTWLKLTHRNVEHVGVTVEGLGFTDAAAPSGSGGSQRPQ